MQDPNPLPWGAQDRFQAHFIVQQNPGEKVIHFTARTRLKTTENYRSFWFKKTNWCNMGRRKIGRRSKH